MPEATALILEDSRTQAQIIARMIEAQGWNTIHCETVREVTDTLKLMTVQAMFLDVFVGEHNSTLHVERFRKLAKDVPLILMTAGSSREAVTETLANARKAGADFVLKKPFTDAILSNIFASMGGDHSGRRKHVLVIDDSATIRKIIATTLSSGGYRVSEAETMEDAFANVDIAHVDLVLCDVFMPGMGGLKGMRMLKATWPQVKIVAMSAGIEDKVSELDAINAARKIGADAQISKPFGPRDLLEITSEMLAA